MTWYLEVNANVQMLVQRFFLLWPCLYVLYPQPHLIFLFLYKQIRRWTTSLDSDSLAHQHLEPAKLVAWISCLFLVRLHGVSIVPHIPGTVTLRSKHSKVFTSECMQPGCKKPVSTSDIILVGTASPSLLDWSQSRELHMSQSVLPKHCESDIPLSKQKIGFGNLVTFQRLASRDSGETIGTCSSAILPSLSALFLPARILSPSSPPSQSLLPSSSCLHFHRACC